MTKCTCPPTSPFLWRVRASELDIQGINRYAGRAEISSRMVNEQRKKGVEPMRTSALSNKAQAQTINPRAKFLQPSMGSKA